MKSTDPDEIEQASSKVRAVWAKEAENNPALLAEVLRESADDYTRQKRHITAALLHTAADTVVRQHRQIKVYRAKEEHGCTGAYCETCGYFGPDGVGPYTKERPGEKKGG
jgi:hypothetical protein